MKYSNQRGQSLFELVIAIGISALIIIVLVSLVANSLQNAVFARNQTLSGKLAQEATEWLRGQRDADTNAFLTNVSSHPESPRCFKNLDWATVGPCGAEGKISGQFVREITFRSVNVDINGEIKNIIEADVNVSWTDSKGLHQVVNATDFSDWRQR